MSVNSIELYTQNINTTNTTETSKTDENKEVDEAQETSKTQESTEEDEQMSLELDEEQEEEQEEQETTNKDLAAMLTENQLNEAELLQQQYMLTITQIQQSIKDAQQERRNLCYTTQNSALNGEGKVTNVFSEYSSINATINKLSNQLFTTIAQYQVQMNQLASQAGQTALQLQALGQTSGISSTGLSTNNVSASLQASLDGYNAELGQKLGESALIVDNTHGWCLAGVNDSLGRVFGTGLYYESAYMAADDLSNGVGVGAHFKEVSVSRDDLPSLPAGCIIVWGPTSSNIHGHISICLGDGRESSDHISDQMTTYSDEYHVYIPIG